MVINVIAHQRTIIKVQKPVEVLEIFIFDKKVQFYFVIQSLSRRTGLLSCSNLPKIAGFYAISVGSYLG